MGYLGSFSLWSYVVAQFAAQVKVSWNNKRLSKNRHLFFLSSESKISPLFYWFIHECNSPHKSTKWLSGPPFYLLQEQRPGSKFNMNHNEVFPAAFKL